MDALSILQLLVLLGVANGAPVLAKKALGGAFAQPLDGGMRFVDKRPILGPSKTIRGVVVSVAATTAAAPVIGVHWPIGALIGATAMLGDLFSSFIKRRFGRTTSSRATGLDQIPEALFPLLACKEPLSLAPADIALAVAAFFGGAVVLSRLSYRIGLRDQPY
jgi:CDP-2,3-bis-(O-geranylgeranyl)-sn-glycerol synthase